MGVMGCIGKGNHIIRRNTNGIINESEVAPCSTFCMDTL